MKITSKTTLKKIIDLPAGRQGKKSGAKILMENGVPCLSCPMSPFEIDKLKIGNVCKMYKLNLEKILKELNSLN